MDAIGVDQSQAESSVFEALLHDLAWLTPVPTTSTRPPLAVGERLAGRLVVERLLGEGGMGRVYRAHDEELGCSVALKVLRAALSEAHLRQEFRALEGVVSPRIVQPLDLGVNGGQLFLTMELVEGPTLHRHLEAKGSDELRPCLAALAEALADLHAHDLVHRDVKPQNAIMGPTGLVLLDLGLARALAVPWRREAAGTAAYMAPEQARGETVGPAADLHALGVILYRQLEGAWPRRDRDGVVARPRPSLGPRDLGDLCAALLDPDPSRRPTAVETQARLLGRSSAPRRAAESAPVEEDEVGLRVIRAAAAEAREGRSRWLAITGGDRRRHARLSQAAARRLPPGFVVLHGACRAREALPFRGVDGWLAALAERLGEDGGSDGDAATIRAAGSESLRAAPRGGPPAERIGSALRRVVARLGEPVALLLDDVDEIDDEGCEVLQALTAPPHDLPILGLVTATQPLPSALARLFFVVRTGGAREPPAELDGEDRHLLALLQAAGGRLALLALRRALDHPGDAVIKRLRRLAVWQILELRSESDPRGGGLGRWVELREAPEAPREELEVAAQRLLAILPVGDEARPFALAVLGRDDEAFAEARRLVEVLPLRRALGAAELGARLAPPHAKAEAYLALAGLREASGVPAAAAEANLVAAADLEPSEAAAARRRAARQLLEVGRPRAGIRLLGEEWARLGLPDETEATTLCERALAGLAAAMDRGERFAPGGEPDEYFEMLWSASAALAMQDDARARTLQELALLRALEQGRRDLLASAVGLYACRVAATSPFAETARLIRYGEALLEGLEDGRAQSIVRAAAVMLDIQTGRFTEAQAAMRIIAVHTTEARSSSWLHASGHLFYILLEWHLGHLDALRARRDAVVVAAEERGDRYLELLARALMSPLLALVDDEPRQAKELLERAVDDLYPDGVGFLHALVARGRVLEASYADDPLRILALQADPTFAVAAEYAKVSHFSRVQATFGRGATALHALRHADRAAHDLLLQIARTALDDLRADVVPWTPGLEAILVAGLAAQRDAKGEAREALAFAAQELEALGWGLHAAAATWQRSRLSGEDARLPALVQEQRLAAPERYLAMLAPIF
ncbi:MAG: serine/threonine-protein kinase [Polyangiaceae bacterium]